nr:immunoglobulin heavy chain junction region [Macaca mulatta]MOX14705.1 immunoglobulin heavy chain junction region [Macaca mulatta]MOX14706.1 immunoglobulin heavy chain junction region [Macaca mulatta]MOX14855.1 immunoglobulin heavy chain junction region [Macaca mulatta]MOX15081.1 immunoglobulin heavy chain junction region [Macaca mulatta]
CARDQGTAALGKYYFDIW